METSFGSNLVCRIVLQLINENEINLDKFQVVTFGAVMFWYSYQILVFIK